jgi:collagen type VII alpha
MTITKVPGPLLYSDLDRQGVDLQFTTDNSPLLYLDFAKFQVAIDGNTDSTTETFTVFGNAKIANILFHSASISSTTDLTLSATGNIKLPSVGTDGLVRLTADGVLIADTADYRVAVSIQGSVANYAALPGEAANGDLWITLDDGHGWLSDGAGGWSDIGQIVGPQGTSGYSGVSGTPGTTVIIDGAVADYASLPGGTAFGDIWVTSDTSDAWLSDGIGGWSNLGPIQGPAGASGYSGTNGTIGADGASGYSGTNGIIGADGASGYSGINGTIGADGASGYSGISGYSGSVGPQGTSGYSGAVTDGTFVPLGTPTDGLWTDGLNAWTPSTTVTDALDDCNELFSYLAPADASGLAGNMSMSGTTLYTGYASQNNTNYKTGLPAGSLYTGMIINDPTFTLTTPSTSTMFNKADEGYTRWYAATGTNAYGAATSEVNHTANFNTAQRAGTQTSTPWTSGQLSVTSVTWYNSFPKWQKGNATLTLTGAQLSQGYNKIKIQREGGFTTQFTNDYEVFYDNDAGANPTVSGTPTAVEGVTVNTGYLSGVNFYIRGSTFKVGTVGLDCFDNVYVLNPLAITSSDSNSMGNSSIAWNDATVTGVTNPPTIGNTMTVTDKVITVPSSNVRSINARVTITPTDPYGSYSGVQSASANRLINAYLNTVAGTSSDVGEFFDDEWYRMLSNFSLTSTSYSAGGAGGWDSTISLVSGTTGYTGLQVYNGGLRYPVTNYSSGYLPSTGQPNYSGASGLRTYIRYFYVGGGVQTLTFTLANQSGTTSFVSVATGASGNNLTMEMLAPNTTVNGSAVVEFKDCYVAYTADTAIGCYASGTRSSSTSNWVCSLGTKSTSTSGSVVVIRITAAAAWTGVLETLSVVGT